MLLSVSTGEAQPSHALPRNVGFEDVSPTHCVPQGMGHPNRVRHPAMKLTADFLQNPIAMMALVFGKLGATGRVGEEMVGVAGPTGKILGRFALVATAAFAAKDAYGYVKEKTERGECGTP